MSKRRASSKNGEHGFTLIELLVVIAILGLLASIVVVRVTGVMGESKEKIAKVQIASLETALKHYYLDNNRYPTTEQGLEALIRPPEIEPLASNWRQGGYLEKGRLPDDPWGNPYRYLSPGVHNTDFDLWSTGADGEDGGEGENADITNWEDSTE